MLVVLLVCLVLSGEAIPSADPATQDAVAHDASSSEQPSETENLRQAIQSFQIHTGNLGMRTDSADGSARNRPASAWHGRVYWNLRNDAFDAVPHEVTQTGGDKGILRRNQYGFSISGPVVIPKIFHGGRSTFFTLTFEGVRENEGQSFLETIATRIERTGDFSQTVDKSGALLHIYDPSSTRVNPAYDPSGKSLKRTCNTCGICSRETSYRLPAWIPWR